MCNKNLVKFNKYRHIRFNYCQAVAKNSDFLFAISILCNTCRGQTDATETCRSDFAPIFANTGN